MARVIGSTRRFQRPCLESDPIVTRGAAMREGSQIIRRERWRKATHPSLRTASVPLGTEPAPRTAGGSPAPSRSNPPAPTPIPCALQRAARLDRHAIDHLHDAENGSGRQCLPRGQLDTVQTRPQRRVLSVVTRNATAPRGSGAGRGGASATSGSRRSYPRRGSPTPTADESTALSLHPSYQSAQTLGAAQAARVLGTAGA